MGKYIFLDANIFLHYKDVEQLNLEQRFGKDIVLVVPRIILSELNKHKDSHKSIKIQKRARSICKKIQDWDKSGQVTDNIKFRFNIQASEPKKHNLNPDSADDRFLADILEFDAPKNDKILVSSDTNIILTAKHLDIVTEEIDESLKLPSSLDPIEIENLELQRKLNRLQNALPKLEIGLIESENDSRIQAYPVFQISKAKLLSDAEINEKVSNLKIERLMPTKENLPNGFLNDFLGYSQEEIDRYNEKIDHYSDQYKQYLYELREYQKYYRIRFKIAIVNNGTAPAENVDVYFHFPNGFEMYLEDDLPEPPREPILPPKPRTMAESIQDGIGSQLFYNYKPHIKLPTFHTYSLKRKDSYDFTDSFKSIKHNEEAILPELFLSFPSYEQVKSFQCTYRITVANLPDIIEGVINFKFEFEK
jgi:PIN domain